MLNVNQLDFLNYRNALKGNYRKGVYAFRTILENPAHAAGFAANLGGVSVVLGWPIGQDDPNSQQLLTLLLNSSVLDQATLTWLSQWYPEDSDDWDTLASDLERAAWMAGSALIWRAVGHSPVTSGKVIATLGGQNCAEFTDIYAVAASEIAMTGVAASQTAMTAIIASPTALSAVVSSSTAMAAVAASQTAMAAIWQSPTAVQAVQANATAWQIFTGASSAVMGKTAAILAGLNPGDYADMTAVAASQTAMAAVASSATARGAVTVSSTALTALGNSPLIATVSGSSWSTSDTTLHNKPCFIVKMTCDEGHSSTGIILSNVYSGASTLTGTKTVNTETESMVNAFAQNITGKTTSSTSSWKRVFHYIPCA